MSTTRKTEGKASGARVSHQGSAVSNVVTRVSRDLEVFVKDARQIDERAVKLFQEARVNCAGSTVSGSSTVE